MAEPNDELAINLKDKSGRVSGPYMGMLVFGLVALGQMGYIYHVKFQEIDTVHATLLKNEEKRSQQIEELLRLNARTTAALEIIASRMGRSLAPYEEQRQRPAPPLAPQPQHTEEPRPYRPGVQRLAGDSTALPVP